MHYIINLHSLYVIHVCTRSCITFKVFVHNNIVSNLHSLYVTISNLYSFLFVILVHTFQTSKCRGTRFFKGGPDFSENCGPRGTNFVEIFGPGGPLWGGGGGDQFLCDRHIHKSDHLNMTTLILHSYMYFSFSTVSLLIKT